MADIEQQPMESIEEEEGSSEGGEEDRPLQESETRRPDEATNGHAPLEYGT